jgi:hypothetical protein
VSSVDDDGVSVEIDCKEEPEWEGGRESQMGGVDKSEMASESMGCGR